MGSVCPAVPGLCWSSWSGEVGEGEERDLSDCAG